jgi:hypothetical protein
MDIAAPNSSSAEGLNRRALELVDAMRQSDPRMTDNPFGPYAKRLEDVLLWNVPELLMTTQLDLEFLRATHQERLALAPRHSEDQELFMRAQTNLILECIEEALTTVGRALA